MKEAFFNWSGGKDSALCLYSVLRKGEYNIQKLLTTLSSEYKRITMHGVSEKLLDRQVEAIGLPLKKILLPEMPSMEVYDEVMANEMRMLRNSGVEFAVYGDIFLEDLRNYREEKLKKAGLKGVFPIWQENTAHLFRQFVDHGFKAVTVCVDERYLDKSFVGREIDHDFLKDLPENVDPCGENGEYHTFVYDGPIFNYTVIFNKSNIHYHKYDNPQSGDTQKTGFWFQDLEVP